MKKFLLFFVVLLPLSSCTSDNEVVDTDMYPLYGTKWVNINACQEMFETYDGYPSGEDYDQYREYLTFDKETFESYLVSKWTNEVVYRHAPRKYFLTYGDGIDWVYLRLFEGAYIAYPINKQHTLIGRTREVPSIYQGQANGISWCIYSRRDN